MQRIFQEDTTLWIGLYLAAIRLLVFWMEGIKEFTKCKILKEYYHNSMNGLETRLHYSGCQIKVK